MATVNIKIDQNDDKLRKLAIQLGWKDKLVEVGEGKTGIQTVTEIDNTETVNDFISKHVKKTLVDNFAVFETAEIQETFRVNAKKEVDKIQDELNSQITVNIE